MNGPHIQSDTHESVRFLEDPVTGLNAIIAVHNTARGPGLGGCRYWSYAGTDDAVVDALRLSEGMSLKNALAGLPFGGGQAIILKGPGQGNRTAMFKAFGNFVESHGGKYITGEDVGTTIPDMLNVESVTKYVTGIGGDTEHAGNPSPKASLGLFAAIGKGVALHLKRADLQGVRVAVQGLGTVGWELCRLLNEAGCKLIVADLNESLVEIAVATFGATASAPATIAFEEVDVFAPCALGAILNPGTTARIKARVVAGSANNQLQSIADGDVLHSRGILYLPDFLVNAGGVICAAREYQGGTSDQAIREEVMKIADRVEELIARAKSSQAPPARVADSWARSLLAASAA